MTPEPPYGPSTPNHAEFSWQALREEAALEESKNARRSPQAQRASGATPSPPAQSAVALHTPGAEPAADAALAASQSMPALN